MTPGSNQDMAGMLSFARCFWEVPLGVLMLSRSGSEGAPPTVGVKGLSFCAFAGLCTLV